MQKLLVFTLLFFSNSLSAQLLNQIISRNEVERIERVLSADNMQGRKTFSPGIEKAADFISAEFTKIGLERLNGSKSHKQEFEMISAKMTSFSGVINKKSIPEKSVVAVSAEPHLKLTEKSGFEIAVIKPGDNLSTKINFYVSAKKNYLVLVDTSFSARFGRLNQLKSGFLKSGKSLVFVLTSETANEFDFEITSDINAMTLANIVGVLPGKSKKNEYVIFSAHYDHIGIGRPVAGDSIFNGANDDAAGTTAVIILAKYFKSLGSQERTLIFTAFTAEEIGGFGARYFSEQLNPADVTAMFNIEMIGTDSKWGNNSAYITGYEKTDLGKILEKNLEGSVFKFYPDPYPKENLFYRSDNATLARLGVPAHTISTSKMDNEKTYHTVDDEISTLDIDNMARIIKAIAISAGSIVNGKDSPSRVDVQQLK